MDLDDVRALLDVIEHQSVQAAAKATRTSRSTLRRRLDALEARVGVPLLVRDAAGAVPTPAGWAVAARGKALLQEASALLHSVRVMDNEPEGLIRFRMALGIPPHIIAGAFAAFRERFPRLEFRVSLADDPLRDLRDDVDAVVHFGPLPASGPWISTTLARSPERLIASTEYLARAGVPQRAEDLEQHALLSWLPPGEDGRRWPLVDGGTIEVSPVLLTADVHMVRQFASAGQGIAFVPDGSVPGLPDMFGEVVPVLDGVVGRACALRAMVPEALAKTPKGRAVLDTLRAVASMVDLATGG